MREYQREEVVKVLKALGCTFVDGSDDGYGFIWETPANPHLPREEYFDYPIPAGTFIDELVDARLVNRADVADPEAFIDKLL
jgi:hypothetical protein